MWPWFTLKDAADEEDSAAQIQVLLTTPAGGTDGLQAIVGAPAVTAANASIVVDDEDDGDITVTVKAAEIARLSTARDWVYDVQMLTTAGKILTMTSGPCKVITSTDVTRAVA